MVVLSRRVAGSSSNSPDTISRPIACCLPSRARRYPRAPLANRQPELEWPLRISAPSRARLGRDGEHALDQLRTGKGGSKGRRSRMARATASIPQGAAPPDFPRTRRHEAPVPRPAIHGGQRGRGLQPHNTITTHNALPPPTHPSQRLGRRGLRVPTPTGDGENLGSKPLPSYWRP